MKRNLYIDFDSPFAQGVALRIYQAGQGQTNACQYRHLQAQTQRALYSCLTTRQREMLISYYLHGENIPSLAKRYGLNRSTVSRHIAAAKRKIKKTVLKALSA